MAAIVERLRRVFQQAHDFVWGLFVFELYKSTLAERHKYQDAMNLIILGEMIGVPLMNSTITLRILPYVLGDLADWKHRHLAEYEVLERAPEWH